MLQWMERGGLQPSSLGAKKGHEYNKEALPRISFIYMFCMLSCVIHNSCWCNMTARRANLGTINLSWCRDTLEYNTIIASLKTVFRTSVASTVLSSLPVSFTFPCRSETFECLRFGTLEDSTLVVTSRVACSLVTVGPWDEPRFLSRHQIWLARYLCWTMCFADSMFSSRNSPVGLWP